MKVNTHGGTRPGAGRKPGPPHKTISFRVRLTEVEPVKEAVRKTIKELRKTNKP